MSCRIYKATHCTPYIPNASKKRASAASAQNGKNSEMDRPKESPHAATTQTRNIHNSDSGSWGWNFSPNQMKKNMQGNVPIDAFWGKTNFAVFQSVKQQLPSQSSINLRSFLST